MPTTKIYIFGIPYTDKRIIERNNNASSIVDWSGYNNNNSGDGNCGTEIKHKIEAESGLKLDGDKVQTKSKR